MVSNTLDSTVRRGIGGRSAASALQYLEQWHLQGGGLTRGASMPWTMRGRWLCRPHGRTSQGLASGWWLRILAVRARLAVAPPLRPPGRHVWLCSCLACRAVWLLQWAEHQSCWGLRGGQGKGGQREPEAPLCACLLLCIQSLVCQVPVWNVLVRLSVFGLQLGNDVCDEVECWPATCVVQSAHVVIKVLACLWLRPCPSVCEILQRGREPMIWLDDCYYAMDARRHTLVVERLGAR